MYHYISSYLFWLDLLIEPHQVAPCLGLLALRPDTWRKKLSSSRLVPGHGGTLMVNVGSQQATSTRHMPTIYSIFTYMYIFICMYLCISIDVLILMYHMYMYMDVYSLYDMIRTNLSICRVSKGSPLAGDHWKERCQRIAST